MKFQQALEALESLDMRLNLLNENTGLVWSKLWNVTMGKLRRCPNCHHIRDWHLDQTGTCEFFIVQFGGNCHCPGFGRAKN